MSDEKKTFDLASLDTAGACDKGAELELRHPVTSEGLGVFITLAGVDSAAFAKAQRDCQNARIRNQRPVTIQDIEKENLHTLAACTIGWRGLEEGGKAVAFSHAAAVDLYGRFPWIREQVNAFIGNRGNFLRD